MKQFGVAAVLFGGALALLAGQRPLAGQDSGQPRNLAGTWDVTLHFPECTPQCTCPGGVPNIPIPALQTYAANESILEVGGGSLFRGPGLGTWEHVGGHEFEVHFKFFLFKPDGTRRGSEAVTSQIELTGANAFEATATFDLLDPMGNIVAKGCPINETATRSE
jgi:hypothetical protein